MCEGQMENAGSLRGVEMDGQTDLTLDLDGRKVTRASLSILRWYGIDNTRQLRTMASRFKKKKKKKKKKNHRALSYDFVSFHKRGRRIVILCKRQELALLLFLLTAT
jgi:hypothetical protein